MSSIENRDDSYWKLVNGNDFGDKQEAVLRILHTCGNQTDKGIVILTGLSLSCVNGRRNELVEAGVVAEVGKEYDKETNRNITVWGIVYHGVQSTQQTPSCLSSAELNRIEKLILTKANDHQKGLIRGWSQ